jgi:hypothetical protein
MVSSYAYNFIIALSAGFLLGLLLPFKNSKMKTKSDSTTTGTIIAMVPTTEKRLISLEPAFAASVPVEYYWMG